jgi:hypothetical protein
VHGRPFQDLTSRVTTIAIAELAEPVVIEAAGRWRRRSELVKRRPSYRLVATSEYVDGKIDIKQQVKDGMRRRGIAA